jgi:hypothetical protein
MAELYLDTRGEYGMELPDVCMKCGAPATVRKSRTFSWFPPWIWVLFFFCGLLPFAIVALIMTKRRHLDVPLCEEHKNHWMWRQLAVVGTLLALLLVGFVAWTAVINDQGPRGDDELSGPLCLGWVALLVVWIIGAVIAQVTSIRPREITDVSITLLGVSPEFVRAYDEEWRGVPRLPLDDLAREHWNERSRRGEAERPEDDSDHIRRPGDFEERRPPDTYRGETP